MPGSSNTSFIPKRNPATGDKRNSRRQVYVGTFVVRILFIASLLATLGVFVYEYRLNKALDAEIVALNTAIVTFKEADLRLSQANTRLAYSASIVTLLEAVEASVTDSVQITELDIARVSDEAFEVQAKIKTTSFDSVMFQRTILDSGRTLAFAEIKDLVLQNVPPDTAAFAEQLETQDTGEFAIGFQVLLAVDQANIPHTIAPIESPVVPVSEVVSTTTEGTTVESEVDDSAAEQTEETNQEQI